MLRAVHSESLQRIFLSPRYLGKFEIYFVMGAQLRCAPAFLVGLVFSFAKNAKAFEIWQNAAF